MYFDHVFATRFNKFIILCLIVLLMGSCAIHKDFPYICLRWGCFAKQVGLPDGRMLRKQAEINAKVRKKKREAKRRKNGKADYVAKSSGKPDVEESAPDHAKRDSTRTTYSIKGDDNYIILVFKEAHPPGKDSLLLKHPGKGDEISEYEKARLKSYLQENKPRANCTVIVKEFIEYSHPELSGSNKIKENIILYLESLGIKRKQIKFKE